MNAAISWCLHFGIITRLPGDYSWNFDAHQINVLEHP
jgi:hypothetical protein